MHYNTGACVEERSVNCALCTAGALTRQSSGDVNVHLRLQCGAPPKPFESDQAFVWYAQHYPQARLMRIAMNGKDEEGLQDLADQMIGIAVYVVNFRKTHVKFCGDPRQQSRAHTVLPFMNRQPDGTVFAVFTSDGTSLYGDEAHWIYAEKRGGEVLFTDFQTDTQIPGAAPTRSAHPMRPGGRPYARSDVSLDGTFMVALAFGDNLED
jgi:hypothetical protein